MIDLKMSSVEVKSETRQLRSTWTTEMAKDLNYYHDLDPYDLEKIIASELRSFNRKSSIKKIFKTKP